MILNMTLYIASKKQIQCGVINLTNEENAILRSLLKSVTPDRDELKHLAQSISHYALSLCDKYNCRKCLISGKTYLIPFLTHSLNEMGIETYITHVKKVNTYSYGVLKTEQRHYGVINCSII